MNSEDCFIINEIELPVICEEELTVDGHPLKSDQQNTRCLHRKYECNVCFMEFKSDVVCNAHIILNHESLDGTKEKRIALKKEKSFNGDSPNIVSNKSFLCGLCHRSFASNQNLNRHWLVHSKERPFSCPICGKQFSQKSNVDIHMVVHTKEKLFKCTECVKDFTQLAGLRKHMLIHRGVRPFQCFICEKNFTQKANMKKHVIKMHRLQSFLCSKCELIFQSADLYERHLDTCGNSTVVYEFADMKKEMQ